MNRLSFTVIEGGRDNPAPRTRAPLSDDSNPARGIAVGMALSFPIWCGLAGFARSARANAVAKTVRAKLRSERAGA